MSADVAPPERPPAFLLDLVERPGRAERVQHLFNRYADHFDDHMALLGYVAPRILSDLVDRIMPGRRGLRVLDLGCGTGLTGLAFRERATRLEGVDLSAAMIAKARERGIYDALEVTDLETALNGKGPVYDLIVAADVLVYIGDLTRTVCAAAGRLAPGGVFSFTVERKEGDGYDLPPMSRWLHSEKYLRQTAEAAGLAVAEIVQVSCRNEWHQPVPGLAVALRRATTPSGAGASGAGVPGGEGALHGAPP